MIYPQTAQRPRVLLVGSIPRPVGGVTQHVWRLAEVLAPQGCEILDLQPDADKYPVQSGRVRQAPYARLARFPWLLYRLSVATCDVVHFHFSQPTHLKWAGGLLARCAARAHRVLTLHHGDLHRHIDRNGTRGRASLRSALCRFDCVVSLSKSQREFYSAEIGLSADRIVDGSSFLPLPRSFQPQSASDEPLTLPRGPLKPEEFVCVASGYPNSIYRHELAFQLLQRMRLDGPARLILCLYGQAESEAYRLQLLHCAADAGVDVLHNVDFPDFCRLLRRAGLYLRPTAVDSFGLAVADAIVSGTPAVATDICDRYPGTFLCPVDDYGEFERVCLRVRRGDTGSLRRSHFHLPDWIAPAYGWTDLPRTAFPSTPLHKAA